MAKAATVCAACQLGSDGILVRMLSEAAAQAAGVIRASSARMRRRSSVLAGEGIGMFDKVSPAENPDKPERAKKRILPQLRRTKPEHHVGLKPRVGWHRRNFL